MSLNSTAGSVCVQWNNAHLRFRDWWK